MRLSRRSLVAGGLTVLAGTVVATRPVAYGQIEIEAGTPEAPPLPASLPVGPTIASVAAELAYDQARILAFVTDTIAYEPYAGALRGAEGTLWGRAGNSVDKAILLGALLKESLIGYRFAFGALDADGEARLATLATRTSAQLGQQRLDTATASVTPRPAGIGQAATPVAPTLPEAEIKAILAQSEAIVEEGRQAMTRQLATIRTALDAAGIILGGAAAAALPTREIAQHCWVQVSAGPEWADLDPVFGEPVATMAQWAPALTTPREVPVPDGGADDLGHTVTVRLQVEEILSGQVVTRPAASLTGPAAAPGAVRGDRRRDCGDRDR